MIGKEFEKIQIRYQNGKTFFDGKFIYFPVERVKIDCDRIRNLKITFRENKESGFIRVVYLGLDKTEKEKMTSFDSLSSEDLESNNILNTKVIAKELEEHFNGKAILRQNEDKLNKFLELAFRKVTILDEYGDENWDALENEIETFFLKIDLINHPLVQSPMAQYSRILQSNSNRWDFPEARAISKILKEDFHEYYLRNRSKSSPGDLEAISKMSGIEFEHYILNRLTAFGLTDVSTTSTSGDQGADIIFLHKGKRFVIQAKRYSSNVGNSAVQEVYAAKGFYKCDFAWVITNSSYTTSARALANQLGVILIEGNELFGANDVFEKLLK